MRKTKPEAPIFRSHPKRLRAEDRRNANIIALHKEGVSFHQIAKLFEIPKEVVEDICKKKVST